jgi:hypothetical protein
VKQAEVFDYLLKLPDGGVEGNTTADLLRQSFEPAAPKRIPATP